MFETLNVITCSYSYLEWMFTDKHGVFGLIPGCANITGDILILVVTIMLLLSLNCVRRSGRFEAGPATHDMFLLILPTVYLTCTDILLLALAVQRVLRRPHLPRALVLEMDDRAPHHLRARSHIQVGLFKNLVPIIILTSTMYVYFFFIIHYYLIRYLSQLSGLLGKTVITEGIVLPSKVTGLVIKKPTNFR